MIFLTPYLVIYANNMSIAQHLPLANYLIVLDEKGRIAEQGTWEDLRAETGYISKVVLKEKEKGEDRAGDRAKARDKIQITLEQPDSNMQDITRKTGDVTIYSMLYPIMSERNT